jgi:hypothetical protein
MDATIQLRPTFGGVYKSLVCNVNEPFERFETRKNTRRVDPSYIGTVGPCEDNGPAVGRDERNCPHTSTADGRCHYDIDEDVGTN